MAKKRKLKISKVKRNNQTTNKMRKQGKLNLQRHRNKVQKQKAPEKPQIEYSSESEASADGWADMLDDEEQQYIMKRLAKQPQLLSNIQEEEKQPNRSRKRKRETKERVPKPTPTMNDSGAENDISDSDDEIEDKYEMELAARPVKRLRPLLPIKTKLGLQERAEECDDTESEEESEGQSKPKLRESLEEHTDSDSGVDGTVEEDTPEESSEAGEITTVQLLAARRDKLAHEKLRIGALCSSLLENPEKKLNNLYAILYLMEERLKDNTLNLHSVRKLATLSACEVFRDILPEYFLRHQDYSNIKLKKDTLALYKHEKELLAFYKRYLQRLEKAAMVLRKKKGDTRKVDESSIQLGLISVHCMCSLLQSRPYFNFASNIAQSIVPFLACSDSRAASAVTDCCAQVFNEDTRGEITLTVVRLINQLVKRRGANLPPRALSCLLALRIRDIDLDEEKDLKRKQAHDQKRKKRIVNLSKKEKKRAKKLKEVERELLETQAQESELARRKQMTEVTKTVFHIYFRLLKTAPRSKLLAVALEGIAKFTHVINLEYYSDLVSILGRLLTDDAVGGRERLLIVRAVLAVLAGAGDALNVDPAGFHAYLYAHALDAHAGATHEDAKIILEAVSQLTHRARRVSPAVLQAFAKRLATLALQLHHNGALGCLALLHQLAQHSKHVSQMLETDMDVGSGRFDPTSPSPEHCNAHAASLHELTALATHYHPTVREVAQSLMERRPLTQLGKLTPLQIFEQYDGSQMAFKPSVPTLKRDKPPNSKVQSHTWTQLSLKEYCECVESNLSMVITNS
ncbi:nucleolar complex protein 3 homolog [Hyposmocoma kahamanoa]|uniref:nucleolar complex protein 3 homolog n=1 Tax=Hyposmocoma kahamanoa TaxID=1477025 RepID=UPI000E6D8BF6|nr:nucleolar complex protein 3 homolog [Hyposmocoma kahamanoa]